ncbi:hypothetical protein LTR85_003201 [Meristemomyces frigidus]|nr:hypothetical protein LTR85_003201 [Meristemomyces frigidus]
MKFPWSSPSTSAPTSPTAPTSPASQKSTGHKRSFSGNILQKLNFLRNVGGDDSRPPSRDKEAQMPKSPKSAKSRKSIDDDSPITSPTSPKAESSKVFPLRPAKTRQRKGSLRKTALLGGKRIMSEGRERKNSLSAKSPLSKTSVQQPLPDPPSIPNAVFGGDFNAPLLPTESDKLPQQLPLRQFGNDGSTTPSSSDSGWSEPAAVTAARLSLVTEHKALVQTAGSSTNGLGSPLDIKSPTSQTSYASTTDDDDILTFDRPANSFPTQSGISLPKPLSSTATSYFPPSPSESSLPVRKTSSNKHERSPLSHTISSSSLYPASTETGEPHDYTETEYWGWIILFTTWLTFTVGMGSCLDIWSWAWDVGETPYAPPELEDDPTLPIVGYYPALMVLTGVVAWVWITVAWVGMKYFRHAKIEV